MKKLNEIKISGVSLPLYAFIVFVLAVTIAMGKLPLNMLGEKLPIMNSYLGGGSVFTLLGATLLATFHIIPKDIIVATKGFLGDSFGFLDFYIAALICGAILGMNRKILVKASARFIPVSLVTMVIGAFSVGLVGMLLGQGFGHSILYVSFPQMVGGMGAGILPLSKIYASNLHGDQATIFSQLAPATTLGNILAIIGAVLISKVFVNSKSNGHGVLIPVNKDELKKEKLNLNPTDIGVGMMFAFTIFLLGVICNAFVPKIHSYAFMIIIVFILKALDVVPKTLENCVVMFNQVIMSNLTHAVLAGIGLSLIDLATLAKAMNVQFIILSLTSVVAMGLAAAIIGEFVGLFPVETAIGAGMINNSMGGTGNIAVLSASDRMEMIAFAQMANRLSGAIILILGGLLASMLN